MEPQRAKVLVVDDFGPNLQVLERRLGRQDFTVIKASSGGEAIRRVHNERPDVVLLDVMMPGIDGFTVLETLRETYNATELPVIMVTAVNNSDDVVLALKIGANDYVTKPIDFPVLLARIQTQLERKFTMRALHESERRYALAMRGANDGLWDWDLSTREIFYSARWKAMLGYSVDEIGTDVSEWFDRIHPKDRVAMEEAVANHLAGDTLQLECEYRARHKDGTYRWMLCRGLAVRDGEGTPTRMAGSQSDTTEGKIRDPLTGLPNRLMFLDRLERAIGRGRSNEVHQFAVLFLDLDRFKLVNDSLGHTTGDLLLIEIARRIENSLRATDIVSRRTGPTLLARLGGDEFTVLVEDVGSAEEAGAVAERIQRAISAPYVLDGQEVCTTTSVGIALSNPSYRTPEEMLRDADNALYEAKENGGAKYEVFDAGMHEKAVARLQLEGELRKATKADQFELYYQPIVDLRTGEIAEFEALIRWNHPSRGMISPAVFVPIAEETGLIHPIGVWVFREACQQLAQWHARHPQRSHLRISINLSRKQLLVSDVVDRFAEILERTSVDPALVTLELTESVVMNRTKPVQQTLDGLLALGLKLTMDDFGTGYSSLSLLHRLPFSALKVDREFINLLTSENKDTGLVKTIVQLAYNLGLDVVAEGVETEDQLQALRSLNCTYGQGYLFAKPSDHEGATALLDQGR